MGTAELSRVNRVPGEVESTGLLADVPLFAGLTAAVRAGIEGRADVVDLAGGDTLFEAGAPSDGLYVVCTGRLEVIRAGAVVREVGRGGFVGELSLLTGAARAATVRARRDSRLLHLSPAQFDALVTAEPSVLRQVAATLAGWVADGGDPASSGRAGRTATLVAVVGSGRGAPVDAVAAALVVELAEHLTVVTPGRVTPAELERAELGADRVVLSAGPEDGLWHEFCLRQADRVVLVGDARHPPPAVDALTGADLVLVGSPPGRERLVRWVGAIEPRRTYQLDPDPAGWGHALAPLARRIAGRSVGLVLAGGGARAFCHLGVIEAFEAAGIEIDRVAGTSLGAIVGAAYAAGLGVPEMYQTFVAEFVRRRPLGDYTVPRVSLSRGRRALDALVRVYGEMVIEELPREFACISVDLYRREAVTHRRGRLVDAVRASMSLPVVLPPYWIGDRLHVDGALLDNLPVSCLAAAGEGPIVAVNITSGGGGSDPSRMPALAETLQRSILMAAAPAAAAAEADADLVIRPDVRRVGLLDFHRLDHMREAGRVAARAALEAYDGRPHRALPTTGTSARQ